MCELAGAAIVTILRNPFTVTFVRKTVLVPVHGNIAASKFVEPAFVRVREPADTSNCVGSFLGVSNSASGCGS